MKYKSGIAVMEGDVIAVLDNGQRRAAFVRYVVAPDTEDAHKMGIPNGGVYIEGGGYGFFSTAAASLENDEDIIFVRRADRTDSGGGKGTSA